MTGPSTTEGELRQRGVGGEVEGNGVEAVTVLADERREGKKLTLTVPAGDAQALASPRRPNSKKSTRLSGPQKQMLAHKLHDKLKLKTDEFEAGQHGHGDKAATSIVTAAISGVINYLLMFGLCAAYGLIMFTDEHNQRHSALAVKMNLGSAMISGILVASFSKIRVAIGGPDLNPVVLLGTFVDTMQVSIADQLGLQLPSAAARRVGSSGGISGDFCVGGHLDSFPSECESYHNQLRATTIFATVVSSLVFALLFLLFGRFRFTRYVSYIPTNIVEAFLSCVGYKVFQNALKFCKYDPFQFVPAACIGVPLYFMKAYHIGHPGIVMPLGFLVPLGIFYVVIYGIMGSDIVEARKDKLMFPLMDNIGFWHVWTDSIGKPEYINFQAWLTTLADLAIMIVLVLLDCLLKIIGTESKMHIKVDKDHEVSLHGMANVFTAVTGSPVAYMQLKFNVINAGVMRNATDRRGAMCYALLCAACYFGTIEPINYMPRFFVSSLLFFAGSGFVCENLWGSRRYLNVIEWVEVLIILVVFIITGQLLLAVITGGCLCGISFVVKYAKVPTIEGKPMRGADLKIVERRGPLLLRNIRHITESWLLVVRLKGFVFFASAQSLTSHLLSIIESEEMNKTPRYRRLRFVVFDCKGLDGVDASASKAIAGFTRDAREHQVRVLWSGLSKHFREEFQKANILGSPKHVLGDLDEAVMSVEDMAVRYLADMEQRWMKLHKSFADNKSIAQEHFAFEPFSQIFLSTTGRIGCPWQYCSTVRIQGHDTVLWCPGELEGQLYLVHSGAVGLFRSLPKDDEPWGSPVAVYRHGWFINRETIMRMPSKFYGVALEDGELVSWTQDQWWSMACERPLMMAEILKSVMKQQARDCDTMEMHEGTTEEDADCIADDDHAWEKVTRASSSAFEIAAEPVETKGQVRIVGDALTDLPEWLKIRLQNLETADSLHRLGFYTPPEGGVATLPDLPAFLSKDLEIAFHTYAEAENIPSSVVSKALMFAGVFDHMQSFQADDSKASYTKDEFMGIGHKALMAPLCEKHRRTIETFFRKADEDADGRLNRHELLSYLRSTLSKHIYLEEADGITSAWGRASFDLDMLTAVTSLFVRKHEHYWHMLQGFLEVLRTDAIREADSLNAADLMKCSNIHLREEEAEEMIWSANWRLASADEEGKLPWTEFVSAVCLCVNRQPGSLPPAPRLCGSASEVSQAAGKAVQSLPSLGAHDNHAHHVTLLDAMHQDTVQHLHTKSKPPPQRHTVDLSDISDMRVDSGPEAGPPSALSPVPGELVPAVAQAPKTLADSLRQLMDDPGSSPLGRFVRRLGYLVIIASVLETILEPFISGSSAEQSETEKQLWFDLECAVTGIFTFEIVARVLLAKVGPVKYLRTFKCICLILATVPLYLELLLALVVSKTATVYRAVNLLRLARLARLSRLAQNHALLEAVVVSLVVIWGIYKKHKLDEPPQ